MPDRAPALPVHPLAARLEALAAQRPAGTGIRLSCSRPSGVFQILAFPQMAGVVEKSLQDLTSARPDIAVLRTAPADWLVLVHGGDPLEFSSTFAQTLGDSAAVVDQSQALVFVRIGGRDVRRLLAKGTAVDLHPDIFSEGQSAATLFNHCAVHLTRIADDTFELIIARSFAESLVEELLETGREFGIGAVADGGHASVEV